VLHFSFKCFFTQGARTTATNRYASMHFLMRFEIAAPNVFSRPRALSLPAIDHIYLRGATTPPVYPADTMLVIAHAQTAMQSYALDLLGRRLRRVGPTMPTCAAGTCVSGPPPAPPGQTISKVYVCKQGHRCVSAVGRAASWSLQKHPGAAPDTRRCLYLEGRGALACCETRLPSFFRTRRFCTIARKDWPWSLRTRISATVKRDKRGASFTTLTRLQRWKTPNAGSLPRQPNATTSPASEECFSAVI